MIYPNELRGVRYGRCEDKQEEPLCACNKMLFPVCGSDGVTYNNPCLLRCQQKMNTDLTMVHYGECTEKAEVAPKCPPVCPLIWAPVCGSDGVTYASMCTFSCKQTQVKGLTMVHHGACEKVQLNEIPVCACPYDYRPVCGSDGVTYGNLCGLQCQQKENSALTVAYDGECQKPRSMPCICTLEYAPVCGSDGITYGNLCGLKCQQKENSALTVAYNGECQQPRSMPVCACPYDYRPVCGSDGVTYGNLCGLQCQQKENSALTVAYNGECQKLVPCICTREWNPICGTDGHTYGNPCTFRCAQKQKNGLEAAHHGEC